MEQVIAAAPGTQLTANTPTLQRLRQNPAQLHCAPTFVEVFTPSSTCRSSSSHLLIINHLLALFDEVVCGLANQLHSSKRLALTRNQGRQEWELCLYCGLMRGEKEHKRVRGVELCWEEAFYRTHLHQLHCNSAAQHSVTHSMAM